MTRPLDDKERSKYYQEIAAAFFKQRGGPFLLSPKDLSTIASWEAMNIPLETVREGIERAFEYYRTMAPVRRNLRSLTACGPQVLKAFERRREREVGRTATVSTHREKKERMAAEVRRFLEDVPPSLTFLKEPFERALGLLSQEKPDEDALEKLEALAERALIEHAPAQDRDEADRAVALEYPILRGAEAAEACRTKLLKSLRDTHRIPYITFPYY
jgi:hypothetical protein